MELSKLLKRQMSRLGMDEHSLPTDSKNWQSLLTFISNAYGEAEQERYLLERSITISSHEFLQLTAKMENAQHIAHLGYWSYDQSKDMLIVSNNLYTLFGLESTNHITNKAQFLKLVHKEDRPFLEQLIERVISQKQRVEHEIRIINSAGVYNWYYMVGDVTNSQDNHQELSGIAMDINKRKQIEEELDVSNKQLINTARLAGMADVAISVLHNIGNTLNSANVAINLIQETLTKPHFQKLSAIANMLKDHTSDIEKYLTQDPKGMLIPSYFIALQAEIEKDHAIFTNEINNLSKYLNHVKEIIAKQQDVRKVREASEKIFLPKVIDDALKISGNSPIKKGIVTHKNYKNGGFIQADKTKVLQILVNLIRNAQESIEMNEPGKPSNIDINIQKGKEDLKIIIEDTGVGISSDNLKKLFTFGFTTKKNGHGFGLHSSILSAREMGGELQAESNGEGATFILTLPLPLEGNNTL